jgi:serine/threonine protein kinase
MNERFFVRCRHCGYAHPVGDKICKVTGREMTPQRGIRGSKRAPPSSKGPVAGKLRKNSFSLLGRVIGGRYRVLRELGAGGTSCVYECADLKSAARVAIKVPRDEAFSNEITVQRFYQEAQVIGSLGHPNVCAVLDTGQLESGAPYLVLELLRGESLQSHIERKGAMSFADTCIIGLQVLEAIAFTHELKVIHRDIKPGNIFLCDDGTVRVLDFGISRLLSSIVPQLTPAGRIMGTPVYLAPEQVRMKNIDGRVDLYAMGVVLEECLFGRIPFTSETLEELMHEVLEVGPIPVRIGRHDCPPLLASVLEKAVEKDRADRFESAAEMYNALAHAYQHLPTTTNREAPVQRHTLPLSPLLNALDAGGRRH